MSAFGIFGFPFALLRKAISAPEGEEDGILFLHRRRTLAKTDAATSLSGMMTMFRLIFTCICYRHYKFGSLMKKRILVLGAGFGGLELSTVLSEAFGDGVEVTLIDKGEAFTFGFSKLDVMFGRTTPGAVRLPTRNS